MMVRIMPEAALNIDAVDHRVANWYSVKYTRTTVAVLLLWPRKSSNPLLEHRSSCIQWPTCSVGSLQSLISVLQ